MKPYTLIYVFVLSLSVSSCGVQSATDPKHEKAASPSPFHSLFGNELINAEGEQVSLDLLQDKVIGVYFSASWCGPCRRFTPQLAKYREKYKDLFEVVLVSHDRTEAKHMNYMKKYEMDWPAIKFEAPQRKALQSAFQATGIPKLVLLNSQGDILTDEGRSVISQQIPAIRLKTSTIAEETYNCGQCSKDHVRKKLVLGPSEDEVNAPQGKQSP